MLRTFDINSYFFFKCNQLCEFFLKKIYFPLESPNSVKNPKKNTHDKLKGQKGYHN